MFALPVVLSFLLAVPTALAAPWEAKTCSLAKAKLVVPAAQTAVVAPTIAPSYIALGVGIQNYTCGATGTYVSAGAVAELIDISCLVNTPAFKLIDVIAYEAWKNLPTQVASAILPALKSRGVCGNSIILGQHYFIPNPNGVAGAISPKWDFKSSTKQNPDAFVVVSKAGGIPAPVAPAQNVDWLSLTGISGKLATQVYRTDTLGGQPPALCTVGSPLISVKYTSKYWFYGSSL